MRDFRKSYQISIDRIIIPEFDISDIRDEKKIKNIIKKRHILTVISSIIILLITAIFAGTTVYAIRMQRSIFHTSSGYKIDYSKNEEDISKELIIEFDVNLDKDITDLPNQEIYEQKITEQKIGSENEKSNGTGSEHQIVYSIESAQELVPFDIPEPDLTYMTLNKIYIYTPDTGGGNSYITILCYNNCSIKITYRYFLSDTWSYETDFGSNYVATKDFTNEYGIQFTIIEGYSEPYDTNLFEGAAAFNNILVIVEAENISEEQLKKIINSMDLSLFL